MSTQFLRTTVRAASASTGMFVPETPTRLYPGDDEFSVVVVGRLLSIIAVVTDVFIAREGPVTVGPPDTTLGWNFSYDPTVPEVFLTITLADGSQVFGQSRLFVAADVGKVHRLVGVCDVPNTDVSCYTNGRIGSGTVGAAASFLPSVAPDAYGVLGLQSATLGVRAWDVCDIAVIDRAFTAREVADLDELILATGGIPPSFAQWNELYQAERLVGHPLVWDVGGLSAGRGWLAEETAPVLSSVLIEPGTWGGSGT
jgi:hypothetical protein